MEENLLPAIWCCGALREKMEQQTTIKHIKGNEDKETEERETQRNCRKRAASRFNEQNVRTNTEIEP